MLTCSLCFWCKFDAFFFKKKIKNIELGADYIIENRPVNSVDFLLFFLIILRKVFIKSYL